MIKQNEIGVRIMKILNIQNVDYSEDKIVNNILKFIDREEIIIDNDDKHYNKMIKLHIVPENAFTLSTYIDHRTLKNTYKGYSINERGVYRNFSTNHEKNTTARQMYNNGIMSYADTGLLNENNYFLLSNIESEIKQIISESIHLYRNIALGKPIYILASFLNINNVIMNDAISRYGETEGYIISRDNIYSDIIFIDDYNSFDIDTVIQHLTSNVIHSAGLTRQKYDERNSSK